jgi:predicted DNA-binding protein (MmcQ/YjbR family)
VAMTWDELLRHCLDKPGAWQDEPWDGDVVAKVGPKIFAFLGSGDPLTVGVKAGTRDEADEWLARFPEDARVMPYIGRHGWNTLMCDGAISTDEIRDAVDTSYEIIVKGLPRRQRPV